MKALRHFITITKHKLLVLRFCFRIRLYWRGLMHDWSKYSWTEFRAYRQYQGNRSPVSAEVQKYGYSPAFLHHKGRNRHHLEYWIYLEHDTMLITRIPYKFQAEMLCDMLAASKVYHKKKWDNNFTLEYFQRHHRKYRMFLHPDNFDFLDQALSLIAKEGVKKVLKSKRLKKLYASCCNNPQTVTVELGDRRPQS